MGEKLNNEKWKWIEVIIYSPPHRWKVRWSFVVHRTFVEQNCIAAFSWTTEVAGENNPKVNQIAPYSLCRLIQFSRRPEIQSWFEKTCFTPSMDSRGCHNPVEMAYRLIPLWNFTAFRDLDYIVQAVWTHFLFYSSCFWNKSPSTSVVWENAAKLFCCKTPQIFCRLWDLTWLSIGMGVTT